MNTLTSVKYTLLTTLVAAVACDDFQGAEALDVLDDVKPRCIGPGCNHPPTNSNVIAGPLDNFPQIFGDPAENPEGSLEVLSATVKHGGLWRDVDHWVVSKSGQLILFYMDGDDLVKVAGNKVAGAVFEVEYTPDGQAAGTIGQLKVLEADCTGGRYASITFCTYTLGTDFAPASPGYPVLVNAGAINWYATCPDDDNEGLLDSDRKFDVVFNHNVALDRDAPEIVPSTDVDMIACLNAVTAKPPYFLNVFFDHLIDPHPRALHSSQIMAIFFAFAAWFDGESWTTPGRHVCFDDPIQGLFSGSQCPAGYVFEGAHNNEVGQVCREATSSHRYIASPSNEYTQLPVCTPQDYANAAGSPTIGVWSVPVGS